MRKSSEDWLRAGLDLLGEVGAGGLTIERLSDALGVTKGSFYHHFRNVEAYREDLIAFWADQYLSTAPAGPHGAGTETGRPEAGSPGASHAPGVGSAPRAASPVELLDTIMRDAFAAVTRPEVAIRVWAHQDEMVRSYVERVDAARGGFVLDVMRAVTADGERARLMADMLSTILVGSMTLLPRMPPERVQALYEEFRRVYGLRADLPQVRAGARAGGSCEGGGSGSDRGTPGDRGNPRDRGTPGDQGEG